MKKVKVIVLIMLSTLIFSIILFNLYTQISEQKKLDDQDYYELYSSYYDLREEYRMFFLLNGEKINKESNTDTYTETYILESLITEEFISQCVKKAQSLDFGNYPIKVYILIPSKEIPYGWQKSNQNISTNFDQSAFYKTKFV